MLSRRRFIAAAAAVAASASTACNGRLGLGATPGRSPDEPMVSLTGNARAVGRRWGELNGDGIRENMSRAITGWRKHGLSDAEMARRTEKFRRFVDKFTPAWMDELVACADAAGVPVDEYVVYEAGSPRSIILMHECSSFAAVGSATADGAPLFHRIRDNTGKTNCAYQKNILDSSNAAGFFAVGNTPSIAGVSCMLNEHGLAGSADMGGLAEDKPTGRGLMNSHIIRFVAERARNCDDALEILTEMVRDRWYAGGKQGTHWLFVDRSGKGLRMAHNSHDHEHSFFEDDIVFSRRGTTEAGKLITNKRGKVALPDMIASGRHANICGNSSIAGMSVRVDPEHPGSLSSMWFAQPAWAPYIPAFPAAGAMPRESVDATLFLRGHELLDFRKRRDERALPGDFFPNALGRKRDAFQEELYANAASVERDIRAAWNREQVDQAEKIAARGSRSSCVSLLDFLAETPGHDRTRKP